MTNTTKSGGPGEVEVWLRQDSTGMVCRIVNPDESAYGHEIGALSMRGSQREVSAWFIGNGFRPDGGWTIEAMGAHDVPAEAWRRFKHAA